MVGSLNTLMVRIFLGCAILLGAVGSTHAVEGGKNGYLLGLGGAQAGMLPPPGVYFQSDKYYYRGLDPKTTLLALIKMIRHRKAADYDAAVRAWALSDSLAAKYVRQADEARLAYIISLFEAAGFKGLDAENRTRLFLYYEAFEPMMFVPPDPKAEDKLIELRHAILTAPMKPD